jgi:predicted RND superfamily exporter protein
VGLLLLAAGLPGLLRLSVQDSWIDNFDPDSPLVRAEQDFNATFWGTYRFDVVLTGAPGFFHEPVGAALVRSAARAAAAAPRAGGVVTYLEPLDTVAELLGLAAGAATLPADALEAVVEVASVYAQQTGLDRLVTRDGQAVRLLVVVNDPDYLRARALAEHIDREMVALVKGSQVSCHASGDIPLALATVRAIVQNQLRSIAWTLVGVGALLLAVNRRLWLTLVQLAPPVAAAWLVLSGMGYGGLPLGVATSMFAALTIGVGVDLALHVTYAYDRERSLGLGAEEAVRVAFESTAAGRWWSTVVLSLGFLVLAASAFGPNHDLGILLAAAMLASYLTTTLFVPRMLAR